MSSRAVEVAKGVPPLAPEREVIWPKRTKEKLANGLQVILAESHSIPKFHGQLIFLSGNAAAADRAPRGELVRLPGGHYQPFLGGHERAAQAELSFLRRHLLDQPHADSTGPALAVSAPRKGGRA